MTQSDQGAACSATIAGGFEARFAELAELLAPVFSRCDLRSNAEAYLRGLLLPGVAGNCWALAQAVGLMIAPTGSSIFCPALCGTRTPCAITLRAFVARHLGTGGVLIFDETGDLKKSRATAGVGRQYTGTAGRIENAIVAVYGVDTVYDTTSAHRSFDMRRDGFRHRIPRATGRQ